jgi:hypothetical protein
MQSDAFPTPPIYIHHFQPRLVQPNFEPQKNSDRPVAGLLNQIEELINDCSIEESQSFWLATDCIKLKHHLMESMQTFMSLSNMAQKTAKSPKSETNSL